MTTKKSLLHRNNTENISQKKPEANFKVNQLKPSEISKKIDLLRHETTKLAKANPDKASAILTGWVNNINIIKKKKAA